MKLLLDTHTFLWHAEGMPNISATATSLLVDPANELYLSAASVWEIAIKLGLGKLAISGQFADFLSRALMGYGITLLPITLDDCAEYAALSFPIRDHRDPFDRLIIIQARRYGASVVGADARFDAYAIQRFW